MIELTRTIDQSPMLTSELYAAITEAKNGEVGSLNHLTLRAYQRDLRSGLKQWPLTLNNQLDPLLNQGFKSLSDKNYWLELEMSASSTLKRDIANGLIRSMEGFFKLLYPKHYSGRPSVLLIDGSKIILLDIFSYSKGLGFELHQAITELEKCESRAQRTNLVMAQNVIFAIRQCIAQGLEIINLESIHEVVLDDKRLLSLAPSARRAWVIRTSFKRLMEAFKPEKFIKKKVQIGGRTLDITNISNISRPAEKQIIQIVNSPHFNGEFGHSLIGVKGRFSLGLRTIQKFCSLSDRFKIEFVKMGLNAFVINEFEFLKELLNEFPEAEATAVSNTLEHFLGKKLNLKSIRNDSLVFRDPEYGIDRVIDISGLKKICPKLIPDLCCAHKAELELLEQKTYNPNTLHTRFSKLIQLLMKFALPGELKGNGLFFLQAAEGKYQLNLLARVQSEVLKGAISRRTAEGYISAIRWICEITNQKFINAYRVTSCRHALHAKRMSTKDTYTLDEVRELAFYVEKAIDSQHFSHANLLSFYFARIQLKTCWNTACLARIQCTDIIEIDNPLGQKPVSVLIQKNRKGYQTDVYDFDPNISRSALHDLIHVRDQITADIRARHSGSTLSSRIFIYESKGELQALNLNSVVPKIAALLSSLGCSVRYNSSKLRKTGANELYRQVAKDIRRYKNTLKHSYATFLKHYQRIDESLTKTTLQDATKTMEQYFAGKEISSDIHIVTDYSDSTQLTPLGGCSAAPISTPTKFDTKTETEIKRCGDFLACVWCKHYRVIADKEHVWQLLSFRNYALSDMQSTTAHFPDKSIQKQSVKALTQRVDEILQALKSINDVAILQGTELLERQGLHPSWEFALIQQQGQGIK